MIPNVNKHIFLLLLPFQKVKFILQKGDTKLDETKT